MDVLHLLAALQDRQEHHDLRLPPRPRLPGPGHRALRRLRGRLPAGDHLRQRGEVPGYPLQLHLPAHLLGPPDPATACALHVHPRRRLHQPPKIYRVHQPPPARGYSSPHPGQAISLATAQTDCTPFVLNSDFPVNTSYTGVPLNPSAIAYPCGFKRTTGST
jgi:hypothetical protein